MDRRSDSAAVRQGPGIDAIEGNDEEKQLIQSELPEAEARQGPGLDAVEEKDEENKSARQGPEVYAIEENEKKRLIRRELTEAAGDVVALSEKDRMLLNETNLPSSAITIEIAEEKPKVPFWRNWKFLALAVAILAYNMLSAVADAQFSKLVNSPTFSGPFFLLWYITAIRAFTFPVYLLIRTPRDLNGRRRDLESIKTSAAGTSSTWVKLSVIIRDIYREAQSVFGPAGLTWKSGTLYLVPFAVLWNITNGFFYVALTFAEVSECVVISSSSTIFVYIICWIFLKEKFLLFKLCGVVICTAGVVLTVCSSGVTIGASNSSLIAAAFVLLSSLSLAVQTVGFKRYLGSPNICQIALFQSLACIASLALISPVFVALKFTGIEFWDMDTAPFGLMSLTGVISSTSALSYYVGISFVSPIFMSLSKPLQIMTNNGIDIGVKGIPFGIYHGIGAGLVILGFLMLLLPNALVSLEIRTFVIKLRPVRRKVSVEQGTSLEEL
ncbi:hypothetical protein BV898_09215 [Hypsibius exemplaris]|uniref:Uncharacterized protein n=1 Tax=Hypsibius exemplaris TaxID=2072580 RepID=A0A1W0WNC8_HYPEX|nr:hypothetical protein BV898_09215 [Hypsibius exemplaris]